MGRGFVDNHFFCVAQVDFLNIEFFEHVPWGSAVFFLVVSSNQGLAASAPRIPTSTHAMQLTPCVQVDSEAALRAQAGR